MDHITAWHIYINGAEQGPGSKVPHSYIRHWQRIFREFYATVGATEAIEKGSGKEEDVKIANGIFKYKEIKVTKIKDELKTYLDRLQFV